MDFKKAFDTVYHEILLYKLECYGIRGLVNDFYRSYLTNRRQFTVINGVFFLLYINDLYRSIGHNAVRLYADSTAIIISDSNLDLQKGKHGKCLRNRTIGVLQISYRSTAINQILWCFIWIQITRVKSVQYLGMSLDANLYWHDHVDQICASLVKYFGIFNHIKNFVSLRISKQLYYAFIYSRIQYGIEAYGSCAKESLSKLQIMQNKLLHLLLKWDRRTPTDLVHQRLSILKIDDVHIAKVLSFVNECRSCRVPEMFVKYYKTREIGLNLRNRSSLDTPWARTDLGLSRCDIKGARLWNNHLQTTSQLLYEKSFHKQFSKFLTRKYN